MLGLEKIIASFVMPPGLFILAFLVLTVYLILKTRSKLIKIAAVLTLILFVFMSTAPGVRLLLIPLENYAEEVSVQEDQDYPIVVLGGGVYYKDQNNAQLSVHSLQRLVKGYQIHKETGAPLIYSGGIAIGQENLSEADIAENFLLSLGMDVEKYSAEERAQSTYENGLYVKRWMDNNDFEKVYLVTSAYHIFRSSAVFEAQGIEFLPVHSGFIYDHKFSWLDYLPNRGALNVNMSALHEWIGVVWYYLRGRI